MQIKIDTLEEVLEISPPYVTSEYKDGIWKVAESLFAATFTRLCRCVAVKAAAQKHKRPFNLAVSDYSKGTIWFQRDQTGLRPVFSFSR